jgi:RNA polymerase sigma-70 factor (ECF subfamily)
MPEIITNLPANAEFSSAGPTAFTTTHWSVVLAAGDTRSPDQAQALEKLCRAYWYPLYAFVRRQGFNAADAQDLTQEFFARLLAKNYLRQVAPHKGRFRSFLIAALKHFLANEWDKARTLKRGGDASFLSLDDANTEARYALEPDDTLSAEKLFARRWALTVLEQVLARLRADYVAAGKDVLFERLKRCLTGEENMAPYAQLARELQMTEGAIKVAVHRLRERYGALLRAEIAQTVDRSEDVDEELRYLLSAVS